MTCIFIIFILFCLFSAKYKNPFSKDFHDDFLSRESTQMINGIFVFLVFMTYFSSYVDEFFKVDSIYLMINKFLGQCVVTTFLFYSGYGITEQIKKDRLLYTKKLITSRFFSLWIKFIICVILYVILAIVMGNYPTMRQILFSFVALDSVGNSAWYIFYMLCAYLIMFFSFRYTKSKNWNIILVFLLSVVYTLLVYLCKNDSPAYYLVSFVFPFGVLFSLYREKIIAFFTSHYWFVFSFVLVFYGLSFLIRHKLNLGGVSYNVTAICFILIVLLISLKIKFENRILKFLGSYIFEIYILQRIPMIALQPIYKKFFFETVSYLFYFFICMILTLFFAYVFKLILKKIR